MDCAGAQVLGVDLAATTVGEWNQVEAAFAAFGILIFPDQVLTRKEHIEFAARWGPSIDDADSEANGRDVHGWLADGSYLDAPIGATSLMLRTSAASATIKIAAMYNAFDTLSSGTQKALEALHAVHTNGNQTATHPLVIRHPMSGRKVLFANPTFTTTIVGMDEAAGLELLNELYTHCLREEFLTAISCEPGAVVLLDNRATMRFGDPLLAPAVSTVSIGGVPLAPAVRPTKADPTLPQRAGATLAGGIITAAMIGIADVLEPEKRTHDIEIVSEAPDREPLDQTLDFGDLPPLD